MSLSTPELLKLIGIVAIARQQRVNIAISFSKFLAGLLQVFPPLRGNHFLSFLGKSSPPKGVLNFPSIPAQRRLKQNYLTYCD